MKAYLIDPWKRSVSEVDLGPGAMKLPVVYGLIKCRLIEVGMYLGTEIDSDVVYVDEEGTFPGNQVDTCPDLPFSMLGPVKVGFILNGRQFVGRGLVVGTKLTGDSDTPSTPIENIKPRFFVYE